MEPLTYWVPVSIAPSGMTFWRGDLMVATLASQALNIAEIEANPGAVSLDQLTKVLAALGGTLHLHSAEGAGAGSR